MGALVFILVLSFLVIIHELGHFFAAKWAKVKTDEFGLGYPPKAIKLFRWKDTDFTLNWIPFGGFVRMQGEDDQNDSSEPESKAKKKPTGQFYQAGVYQKLVIILAGATVNFVFGIIAFTVVFTKMGIPEEITEARVGLVVAGSPAAQAGLPEDVTITAVKYESEEFAVARPNEVIDLVYQYRGKTVTLVTTGHCEQRICEDSKNEYEIYVRTQEETPQDEGAMGIAFDNFIIVRYSALEMPFRSAAYGVTQAIGLGWQIVQAFSGILTDLFTKGRLTQDVAGPIGIVHQAQTTGIFQEGWYSVLSFAGMLSINLAVMNVLPIPPLDGGRAVFVILESLLTKKRTQRIEYMFNYGGYILLFGLIIIITIKDVLRIFYG
ncbi:MAG: RIP metalloprotease RseP [Patescibacteria group bacterium]|nr:MAG: RIP metalloprotease RseP [Patescibacteria group bacterium]